MNKNLRRKQAKSVDRTKEKQKRNHNLVETKLGRNLTTP